MALVNITKRVRIEGKGWRFCEVVFGGNRKIKPNAVLIDGQEQVHPEGRYYIDFLQEGSVSVSLRGPPLLRPRLPLTNRRVH